MAKTYLPNEEKKQVIEALNNDTEPPGELMAKCFRTLRKSLRWPNLTGPGQPF